MDLGCQNADNGGGMDWTCSGDGNSSKPNKYVVFNEVLKRLGDEGFEQTSDPSFADELLKHFFRLPLRYALDVNTERPHDVLIHKKLLELAEFPENLPVFHVRAVNLERNESGSDEGSFLSSPMTPGTPIELEQQLSPAESPLLKLSVHPPPAFGSAARAGGSCSRGKRELFERICGSPRDSDVPMHEITFSTIDKPKLLSQLTTLLADVSVHIWEAHIFSTVDGFSLDVFVVYGWHTEESGELEEALRNSIGRMEECAWLKSSPSVSPSSSPSCSPDSVGCDKPITAVGKIPLDAPDDWEIDPSQLKLVIKVQSSSNGDVYRGSFCGQDVSIKVIKPETWNKHLQEFVHEIFIMRKVRHKNIVQFIGACTKPPNLCIVTEYMSGGSVHDFIQKQKGVLKFSVLLRIALDVSKGMDYLHQNKIIHRDLRASSLLMDENEVVKVADFGVARFQAQNGIMTAETGTYRWMAPEVIGHNVYDHKADVYSFGIVLWELLTRRLPYDSLTPFQAAVGVLQEGLRPVIPDGTHPMLSELLNKCWKIDPSERPNFSEITIILKHIIVEEGEREDESSKMKKNSQSSAFFFSALKRNAAAARINPAT